MELRVDGTLANFAAVLLGLLRQMPRDARDDHAMHVGIDAVRGEGLWLEFGVFDGHTLAMMAARNSTGPARSFRGLRKVVAAASSLGLTKYVRKGAFDRRGVLEKVAQNARVHVGLFNTTLPPFLARRRGGPVAFLHIDSDLFSSACFVLERCRGRLRRGSVMVFPEYKEGELRALHRALGGYTPVLGHNLRQIVDAPNAECGRKLSRCRYCKNLLDGTSKTRWPGRGGARGHEEDGPFLSRLGTTHKNAVLRRRGGRRRTSRQTACPRGGLGAASQVAAARAAPPAVAAAPGGRL